MPDVGAGITSVHVMHHASCIAGVIAVILHRGAVKLQFLLVKAILVKEQCLLNQPHLQSRRQQGAFSKQLMGEYQSRPCHKCSSFRIPVLFVGTQGAAPRINAIRPGFFRHLLCPLPGLLRL
jgi:hypothetical protein